MHPPSSDGAPQLKRFLKPIHLWAIAVGLVISGDYFGWNYGLGKGGPVGMMIATLFITLLYVCLIFSYTELATAIPNSGGPFAFARRALGPTWGFLAGLATLVEFVIAPAAIARGIGAYVNFRVPELGINTIAIGSFVLFGALNAWGVGMAAMFELVVTAAATFELFLFFFLTAPHVQVSLIVQEPLLPFGVGGILAALPFAVWFYLAIEGVAMSAEETLNPERDIPRGYIAGILTLVTLALGTLICTTGLLPYTELIKDDSPLPKALASVLSPDHPMTHLMVYLGLFGLIASFHGIMMGYSRQVFALAREGYLPRFLAYIHPTRRTPIWAIVVPAVVGIAAVLSERTDEIITLSCLGAVTMYVIAMASLFALRRKEPDLARPFKAPFYPVMPAVALAGSVFTLGVFVVYSDWRVTTLFVGILVVGVGMFRVLVLPKLPR